MNQLIQRLEALLQGEPLRAIVYGAALVVWLVVGIANALHVSTLGPTISLDDALLDATAAAAGLTELARRFVTPVAAPQLPAGTDVTVTHAGEEIGTATIPGPEGAGG